MRDRTRIIKIVDRLRAVWEENPELRLLQLLGNVYPKNDDFDPYYTEDEDFISELEQYYENKPQ